MFKSPSHVQRFAKHQPYDLAIGFALRVCHRPSIDIHRRLDRGVTHQLLLHLHRSAGLIEPGGKCGGTYANRSLPADR